MVAAYHRHAGQVPGHQQALRARQSLFPRATSTSYRPHRGHPPVESGLLAITLLQPEGYLPAVPEVRFDFLPDHANLVAGVYRPDIPDTIRSVLVLFVPEADEYCGCCHAHKDWPTHESAPETEGPGYLVIVNERKRRSRYRCGLGRLRSLYPGAFRRRYLLSQAYANHSRRDFPASREPHSRLTPWVVAAS